MLGNGVHEYCVGNRSRRAFSPSILSPIKTLFSWSISKSRFTSTRLTRCSQHNLVLWIMSRCFMHVNTSTSKASSSTIGMNFKVTVSTFAMDEALRTTCSKKESAEKPFRGGPCIMNSAARGVSCAIVLWCARHSNLTRLFFSKCEDNYKLLDKILCRFNELRRNYAASTSTTRTCCSCLANRSIRKKLQCGRRYFLFLSRHTRPPSFTDQIGGCLFQWCQSSLVMGGALY